MASLLPWLLHHVPTAGGDVGGVRGILGASWLVQLSVTMHAVGALLVAGALVGVLVAQRRRAQEGALPASGWTSKPRLRGLLAAGWGVNLLGGIMRLFQPDHPSLVEFFDVAWVQVITVKHVILLAAILASLIAVGLAPLALKGREQAGAAAGLVLVLLAAVLGGAAVTLPIPSMQSGGADGPLGLPSQPPGEHVTRVQRATLQLVATPLESARQEVPFQVDHWAFALRVHVNWESPLSEITAHLVDPDGRTAAQLAEVAPQNLTAELEVNLYPGTWALVIESDRALAEQVEVVVRTEEGSHGIRVFEGTVTVRERFFELNFWMDQGDWFRYEWRVPAAYGAVDWDIHSHPDPATVTIHHEGTDSAADGNFTAARDRIYSILWLVDPDQGHLTLTYRVEGTFRLHSIYG